APRPVAKTAGRKATPAEPGETLRDVGLGHGPADYEAVFDKVLAVVGEYFEVEHANRYDGRIETFPALVGGAAPRRRAAAPVLSKNAVRRRARVQITPREDGGFTVRVRVDREAASVDSDWQPAGRDTELEQVLLRRLTAPQAGGEPEGKPGGAPPSGQ